jgi:polygalacturonase/Tol biopolymer transport system component
MDFMKICRFFISKVLLVLTYVMSGGSGVGFAQPVAGGALSAQPVAGGGLPVLETGSVRPMPAEWIDKDTRHEVVRLSSLGGDNASFYFHDNPFVGDKMVFYHNEGKGKQLYTVDLGTKQTVQVTHASSPMNGEIVGRSSGRVFYQIKDSVFFTNIYNGETKLVFVFPGDFKGNVTSLNANEELLAGVQSGDEEKEILRKYPEKKDFFNRIYDAHIPHTLFTIDLRTGELKKIRREDTWIGHVQFSPTDPALLMFCHEGPWHKVDRIWTIDVATAEVRLMHKRTMENEIAGHEFFSPKGDTIWFDWQMPKGQTFFLGGVDVRTGKERKYEMTRDEWSIHFNVCTDGFWMAGDGGDSGQVAKAKNGRWIYLFHPEGDRLVSEKLVNMKGQYYKLEPNVHFSPDGKWVIFRANFEGHEDIYAASIRAATAGFEWPAITATAKPWTRWWWMGSAVNKADLTENMEQYKSVGLGGLELTPIYGVKGYESKFISYLSPAWMDMLQHTLKEANRLGLGLDMATGTGWPFGGGPLIDGNYACKDFVYKSWSMRAGETLKDTVQYIQEPLVHSDGSVKLSISELSEPVYANKDLQRLALFQVRWPKTLPLQALMAYSSDGKVVDLTGKVDGAGRLRWTAPSGDWLLYGIFQGWHGKMVERAAPGGEGNVIDHFSQSALQKYLSRFDSAFAGRDMSGLRAFFNDSYEVDDARGQSNWTPGFFEIFRSRRGYDLREHLPELLGGGREGAKETLSRVAKGPVNRVLCDYRETISELLLDEFTKGWANWAHRKGGVIRNQAHGSPANILDLYAVSDIPETEGADILRYKFATSAAHVMGKPLVSAEAVTWLDEHFLSSPANVKKALDLYWLGGVNHIFYHGTAYTPASDAWPGWLFYAAVHFTPNDPCWKDFGELNRYVARCQSFLQQGVADNDVLLYYPMYDSWMDPGHELLKHYDKMEANFDGTGFAACASEMVRRGYAFDYISDKQILSLRAEEGNIRTSGDGEYRTVLLPGCRYISPETFRKLMKLAEEGAQILVYKAMPGDVPGWNSWSARKDSLIEWMEQLGFSAISGGLQRATVGKGVFLKGDDLGALLHYARIRREVMVDDSLDVVRRVRESGRCYFIVNRSSKPWVGWTVLADSARDAVLFDPMKGISGLASVKHGREIYLRLMPGESVIVQTYPEGAMSEENPEARKQMLFPYYYTTGDTVALDGEWALEFLSGGPVLPAPSKLRALGSWTNLGEDAARFSGAAKYVLHFNRPVLPDGGKGWMLELGEVSRTARVSLNGRALDTLIGPYFKVMIPTGTMKDSNILEVVVSNGMVNRIEDMDRRSVVWKKFYNYNFPPHVREDRGADGLFTAAGWKPEASGLLGPVRLVAVKSEEIDEATAADSSWVQNTGARLFTIGKKLYTANDYGAVGDGITLASPAIQAAIDDCAKKGGGVVVFKPGSYLSGSLFLREGVELRIDKEVTLKGSTDFKDYPLIDTRIAGIEMKWPAALLNIIGVRHAAITGEGKVDAQGKFCWDKYWAMRKLYDPKGLRWIVDYDVQRIRMVLIQRSTDILIKGIHCQDAGFWTVQILYSSHVTVDGVVVRNNEHGHGPSTDGVDIDSSSWVLVENCDIDCNDDDFCLKAGRDWDGLRVGIPTEYVVIRHCVARKGGGLLTLGSETSGGIRHVLATDLVAHGTGNGFHIKSATTRGGVVEDIHLRNITMDSVGNAILFTMNWNPAYSYSALPAEYNADSIPEYWKTLLHRVEPAERGIPHFRDIYITGMYVRSAKKAVVASGLENSLITGVHMNDVRIKAEDAGELKFIKNWEADGLDIVTSNKTTLQIP